MTVMRGASRRRAQGQENQGSHRGTCEVQGRRYLPFSMFLTAKPNRKIKTAESNFWMPDAMATLLGTEATRLPPYRSAS
jgi:hypothetical protein